MGGLTYATKWMQQQDRMDNGDHGESGVACRRMAWRDGGACAGERAWAN